ncbi:hypothetical protein D8B26_002813 [Coccidioides posadasii str. Silveira]|nr:hypothetical protein CPC735_009440 [Coccidioides posadasii C735 delta SOWgp]EER26768.1 hypothetical protein CPC735_009440 [Coccidioides posadasii C735 delta SOWgp]KMM72550.1 hypothetical protein CPAG_08844 [Coccidioides posadasii RMSCC 3488]QVM08116.1 hypothetical protein D8B26_002813 [Coccidioides posadasii str. Silveira]|eukprot:XP_003068913.1 hypothetical protein CPC735_009440 [Coccidioides posadasii C735 delta SOWgp]
MASDRRSSAVLRGGMGVRTAPPGIAALFLIHFDIKAGYTIVWKESLPDVVLHDVVEFKSLPSGLHNVKEDLVYFVQDDYAGLSAFVNQPADESERNALMLAVGVLVPLSQGRLGKAWRHAASLKELARKLANDYGDTKPLADYWEAFQLPNYHNESPPDSPLASISGLKPKQSTPQGAFHRGRTLSDATALLTSKQLLAPYHPALCLPDFKDTLGPLIFPLYRAALLRKRILFLGDAPVETSCNFVYDLALLSSLPQTLSPFLPPTDLPAFRPRALFNVGVHDLPYLTSLSRKTSPQKKGENCWIACTSDRVLGLKPELYDVLIDLPPPYSKDAPEKVYPKLMLSPLHPLTPKDSKQIRLKATQRDVRRYLTLREGLNVLPRDDAANEDEEEEFDNSSTFSTNSLVEPLSWPLLAYTSFIWWASAGEKGAGQSDEEKEQDAKLLLPDDDSIYAPGTRRGSISYQERDDRTQEIALITYFRRLTTQIFTVLFDIVSRQDEERSENAGESSRLDEVGSPIPSGDEEEYRDEPEEPLIIHANQEDSQPLLNNRTSGRDKLGDDEDEFTPITTTDMAQMGLDPWSEADRRFVEELVQVWWDRKAQVQGGRIKCCGVRIL